MKQPFFMAVLLLTTVFTQCKKGSDNTTAPSAPDPSLTFTSTVTDKSGNTYQVGYTNPSNNNKVPFVLKKNAGGNTIWRIEHESTPVDGTATCVALDANDHPWVVFTVDGGSSDAGYINKKETEAGAFDGVLFNNYGAGGGPKIAVLAHLNPASGKIVRGTFFMSRLDKTSSEDGPHHSGKNINDPNTKTNSFVIDKIGIAADKVTIEGSNTYYPPAPGSTQSKFIYYPDYKTVATGKIRYYLSLNLSGITGAEIIQK